MTPRRWVLPRELAALSDPAHPGRTARDWAVDTVLFGLAVLMWLWQYHEINPPDPGYAAVVPAWMNAIDPWVGAAACLALWWRRRAPLVLAMAMIPALTVSATATGAVLVSILTVAIHRDWLPATLITAAQVAQALGFALVYQPPGVPFTVFAITSSLMFIAPLGWGIAVRARRQLVVSLRREAERERREHELRLGEERRAERYRIARDMHDVLAHRISLLSVHSNALTYRMARSDVPAGELREAMTLIHDNARQALVELGEVLHVLRSEDAAPSLHDIARLAGEARAAGQQVTLEMDEGLSPPPQSQRTAYRMVQEGLTNARKHAPESPVTVAVGGAPGGGLHVSVTNPLPATIAPSDIPGAGAGLTGLAERIALDGGSLRHETNGGSFRLSARLPWPA